MQTNTSSNTDAAEPSRTSITPPREQFAKPWRWLTVVAGLLLAATFFVPYAEKTNIRRIASRRPTTTTTNQPTISGPVIDSPCAMWGLLIDRFATSPPDRRWHNLPAMTSLLVIGTFPPFWGFAMAVYSLSQLFGLDRFHRVISWTGSAACVAVGLLLTVPWTIVFFQAAGTPAPPDARAAQAIYFAIIVVIIVLFTIVPILIAMYAAPYRGWSYLYHSFIIAFLLACPLGLIEAFLAVRSPRPYGLTLFIMASCLLLLARIGEARAVSRLSWF